MLALGRFCHNLWQNWRGGIQTVEILTIPDVPWRETCVIREFRSHVKTDILKKTRTVSGSFCELLRYVLTEIPVEIDQRRIDGNRRLDLRCAVSALEIGDPCDLGLRLDAAIHKSRSFLLCCLLHVSSFSKTVSVSTAGEVPMPAIRIVRLADFIRSPPNGRLCRGRRGGACRRT